MDIINPLKKNIISVQADFCGRPIELEINRLAFRSKAAVLAKHGDTVVLVTANVGPVSPNMDYFPLTIDYEERFYAAGKISGSRYIKRETKPSDEAVLTARLIDRPIRPLFPKGYRNEVQVVVTVLSLDPETRPDSISLIAASAALSLTGVPFKGPVAGIRIAKRDGELVAYPSRQHLSQSSLDIFVASNEQGIMMVESTAKQIQEDDITEALKLAHEINQTTIALQKELISKVEVTPQEYELYLPGDEVVSQVKGWLADKSGPKLHGDYFARLQKITELEQDFEAHFKSQLGEDDWSAKESVYRQALENFLDQEIRQYLIDNRQRVDGRKLNEVRPLSSQVGLLPRVHGSALFTRGVTQALNVVTLAPLSFAQSLDTMEQDTEKRFFHHYNAPGYTLGEVKRMSSPGRREVGHSYLAEKALLPVIPDEENFPYTIRTVTEIMSQHGSTSMAATCSSCMALMDAGVPIKAPVAGLAMGLIMADKEPIILTDIQDAEDFAGDMDFKVAGTAQGITALQMDIKVNGLPVEILDRALKVAKVGRLQILEHMLSVIPKCRSELSPHAPRVETVTIPVSKIRDLIGKGGETIQALIAETDSQIDIQDSGQVLIFAQARENLDKAKQRIQELIFDPEIGHIYEDRKVVKVSDFGVFVAIMPNKDGMVHVSEISNEHIRHPGDVLKEGDKVTVKVISIDDQGRISLSIKRAIKSR